jgi:hypothetical protein
MLQAKTNAIFYIAVFMFAFNGETVCRFDCVFRFSSAVYEKSVFATKNACLLT